VIFFKFCKRYSALSIPTNPPPEFSFTATESLADTFFAWRTGDHPERDQVQQCLRQACEKLIDEVNGTLRYFAARHHLAPVLLVLFLIGTYWSEQIELQTRQ
jgi:hypothetical protein